MSAIETELWIWYPITLVVVGARIVSRRLLFGSFKKLQLDDYLMLVAVVTFTILIVGVRILSYTETNLIDPSQPVDLTPDDIAERVYGSKMVIVVEQMQIMTIWIVKTCLLIMYSRLTTSLNQNIVVKAVAVYVACGFVIMEILFFGVWCRPFWHYWEVPTDNLNCSAEHNHMITNAVLNISSDIMIISLPMPVFIQAQLPLKRKAILCAVFALGSFTILSAILNKYYSFSETYGTDWIFWYIREAATAIITSCLPLCWTLMQRLFRVGSFNGKSSGQRTGEATSRFRSAYGNLTSRAREENRRKDDLDGLDVSPSESQEQINPSYGIPLKIYQHNEVRVTSEEVDTQNGLQISPEPSRQAAMAAQTGLPEGMNSEKKSSEDAGLGVVTTIHHSL
ncbi:hypothetical protein BX600DRAFT_206826 [Xylariales sp. PMI_506]|nr:hypothetical protein BX600DRAFT_206826 [Xylariales sp. PMI_506]